MFALIRVGTNDSITLWKVSKRKIKIENYLKEKGYYWSKKHNRYVDDKNCGIDGGSGVDYIIKEIDEI